MVLYNITETSEPKCRQTKQKPRLVVKNGIENKESYQKY